ncbi:hypothetical protein L9F63_010051 [Diploptera punctata]|uniref:DRBM domain-containing protein n=1 Tax=Diploptera punctata TaxID=6984 RepID=A0AAD8AI69_DIPPU|nr:hypothetical protein L9F63_010051 [Diploptera punctata]
MVAHKNKYSEERLVCLAQVFTNIEFMGCRYPAETMQLVAQLAEGVADSYREKQKNRLQRTFVQASDAAGAKAKGLKRPAEDEEEKTQPSVPNKKLNNTKLSKKKLRKLKRAQRALKKLKNMSQAMQETQKSGFATVSSGSNNSSSRFNSSHYGGAKTYHIGQSTNGKFDYKALRTPGPYGNLILIEPVYQNMNPNHIINTSAGACHIPMESRYTKEEKRHTCKIFLNGTFLAEGIGDTKKAASRRASESGLEMLKRMYYTVKVCK